jgi:Tol biopolymer transport system component
MKKYRFIPFGLIVLAALAYLVEAAGGGTASTPVKTPDAATPTPDLSTMQVERGVETSPDRKWVVEDIRAYSSDKDRSLYYLGLIARSADGEKEWRLVDEWMQGGEDKLSYVRVLLWSEDGRTLYYDLYLHRTLKDRCKFDPLRYDLEKMDYGHELRKVDLESGEVTELASCVLRPEYSPDHQILPYIGDGEIVLIEVDSGQEHVIPFDVGQKKVGFIGYIGWSPDSKAFAFGINVGGFGPEYESVVWVVDVEALSAKQLVVEGEKWLEPGEWEGPGRLAIINEWPPSKKWVWDRESDTITRQAIPTETPTPVGRPTPDLAAMDAGRQTFTSPDGGWIAETTVAFPSEGSDIDQMYIGLTIRRADGKVEWKVVDEWGMLGLGWSYPQPVRWSKDGRSLYYTYRVVPDGGWIFPPEAGLYKVDLKSGRVTELFSRDQYLSWFSLSPDEKTLAYIKDRDSEGRLLSVVSLVLRELDSGEERAVVLGQRDRLELYAAQIVWSPDGKVLAITIASELMEYGGTTSILLVDTVSLAVKPIVVEDKRYLVAGEWVGNDRLLLMDPQRNIWSWDRESGELTFVGTAVETPVCAATETPTVIPTDTSTPTASPAR